MANRDFGRASKPAGIKQNLIIHMLPVIRSSLDRPPILPMDHEKVEMIKILLVEDSKFLRLATERALTRAGYEVFTAIDGQEALKMAPEKHPDLILLDMLLPGMTGPDVLKALKKDPATAKIAVVVLTGLSQKNAERLRHDGAFAFLEKSGLALERGSEPLLLALADILKQLKLEVPASQAAGA